MPAHRIPKSVDGEPIDWVRQIRSIETAGEEVVQVFEWDAYYVVVTRARQQGMFETRPASREEVRRAATRGGR